MEEAARVIKEKSAALREAARDQAPAPGPGLSPSGPSIYYPTRMYDSYTAFEAEEISGVADRQKYTVQSARKSRTFYFNGLDGDGFDAVINPVVLEPVVQFTLYLKVKYEVEPVKAK